MMLLSILAVVSLVAGGGILLYAFRLPTQRDPGARRIPTPQNIHRYPPPPSRTSTDVRAVRPPPIPPPITRSEVPIKRAHPAEVKKPLTPREIFEKDPAAGFAAQFALIENTLQTVREKFARIDKIFGDRVLKNTSADVANHLMAKELLAALEKKRSLMLWYKERTDQDPKTTFDIGFGKMSVATSPVGTPSADNTAYMDLEEVEREFERIVKSFQRRKTFYEAFFPRRQ